MLSNVPVKASFVRVILRASRSLIEPTSRVPIQLPEGSAVLASSPARQARERMKNRTYPEIYFFISGVFKNLLNRFLEQPRQLECQGQAWIIFLGLNGVDG